MDFLGYTIIRFYEYFWFPPVDAVNLPPDQVPGFQCRRRIAEEIVVLDPVPFEPIIRQCPALFQP
jgi:hypothetical protein